MKRKTGIHTGFSQISTKIDFMKMGARRDITDVLRTVFWYEGLLLQTKERTAYKLAKKFDPGSFGIKNEVPYSSSKWQKYAKGNNTPSIAKVATVELAVSGSASEINHVLWKVLHLKYKNNARDIDNALMQLNSNIRSIVYQYVEGRIVRREVSTVRLDSIVKNGNIDSLACLTILLREAAYCLKEKLAFEIALRLHQVLLILGVAFHRRRIGNALIQLYSDRIFPLVKWKGYNFYIENEKFIESSYLLNELAFSTDEDQNRCWARRVQKMSQIFAGRYGMHFCLALQPIYGPNANDKNLGEISQFRNRRHLYMQAWESIYANHKK